MAFYTQETESYHIFLTARLVRKSNQLNHDKPKVLTVQADISLVVTVMGANGCLL
jgi:hypothetical protein